MKNSHSYDQFRGQRDTSENFHLKTIDDRLNKRSAERWRKTPEEKEELKKQMSLHPTGKHAPDNSKVVLPDAIKQAA